MIALAGALIVCVPRWRRRESLLAGSVAGALAWVPMHSLDAVSGADIGWPAAVGHSLFFAMALAAYLWLPRPTPTLARPFPAVTAGAVVALGAILLATRSGPMLPDQAPSGPPTAAPPVVLIVLDTVRADRLELYGYSVPTMPELAQFARRNAVVVDRAVSQAPWSLPSHASLFTGLYPPNHGAHRPPHDRPDPSPRAYPLRGDVPTLAELLRRRGYTTIGLSANFGPLAGYDLDRGFDWYRALPSADSTFMRGSPWYQVLARAGASPFPPWYRRAGAITDEAIRLVDAAGTSGFFLFVNYFDAHDPYDPPPAFRPPMIRGSQTDQRSALYDAELRYLDQELARLLAHLQRHTRWDELLLVITADHGEGLGERGHFGHVVLYDSEIRVPLILKPARGHPDIPSPGRRWHRDMQLVDIAPLVLDHAGVPSPALDGRGPEAAPGPLRAWAFRVGPEHPVHAQRSVEIDRWKLIEDDGGQIELYDLRTDPQERHDLSAVHPDRARRLQELLGPRTGYRMPTGQR